MAPTKLLSKFAKLSVRPDDGSLKLAVIADTHSRPHPSLAGQLAALRPDAILHAGDVGDPKAIESLATIAPLLVVRGNIDERAPTLPDVLTLEVVEGEQPRLRILLLHIGVSGPRLRSDVARLARAEAASLVVCGHSHVPFLGQERGLTVFNPGSCGPRRFHLPVVFGTIELTRAGALFAHVNCETGQPWSPP
ncbi:MAG: metallophosphoesterase family protein [Deltaproteobacteria bacterium]|nr:metallophosphoesterase family protein [Deltaproteobacteria bacterium]